MPKPVNDLTPDAPDSERPGTQRIPKMGSGIRVLPMPKRGKEAKATAADDSYDDIYTAEKGIPPMPDEGPTKNVRKYASGGSVSARADGCAQRGKTKCRIM